MVADKWRMDGGSGGKGWQIGIKSNIITETAPALYPWLRHSAILVKNVAERWRICRQVHNISAMIEGRGSNDDAEQEDKWGAMRLVGTITHEGRRHLAFSPRSVVLYFISEIFLF